MARSRKGRRGDFDITGDRGGSDDRREEREQAKTELSEAVMIACAVLAWIAFMGFIGS